MKNLISLLTLLFLTSVAVAKSKPVIICDQEYALCTSAACIPDPANQHQAICSCLVEKGDSAGFKSCALRAPKENKNNTRQLVSTFSFLQFTSKKTMDCDKGQPWTDCVDAPCTVDPMDAKKALCSCKIIRDQAFFTFGGNCDLTTCDTGFWSGATVETGKALRDAMAIHLKHDPATLENTSCVVRPPLAPLQNMVPETTSLPLK